jgi:hypothetical protein
MDVELCLLALPGVHKDDLKTIFSHPQVMLKNQGLFEFIALVLPLSSFLPLVVFFSQSYPSALHVKKLLERPKLENTFI